MNNFGWRGLNFLASDNIWHKHLSGLDKIAGNPRLGGVEKRTTALPSPTPKRGRGSATLGWSRSIALIDLDIEHR